MSHIKHLTRLALPAAAGVLLAAALLAGMRQAALALEGGRADLGAGAEPYEINVDASGRLWISEYGLNRARHLDPATGAYTLYTGLPGVVDAKLDATGALWWTGYDDNSLGRLDPTTGQAVTYSIKASNPWGFDFDANGKLWIMDDGAAGISTFEPVSQTSCIAFLPGGGGGAHARYHNGAIWASDYLSDTIVRITPTTLALTRWTITNTADTTPYDLDFEPDGTVWFGDVSLGKVVRLEPDTGEFTLFGPPELSSPSTVRVEGGKVWYTDYYWGNLGFIDPAVAAGGGAWTVAPVTGTLAPGCFANIPFTFTAGIVTGTLLFDSFALTSTVSAEGTTYYLDPSSEAWGLRRAGGVLWVTGAASDRLYRADVFEKLFLPLIMK
jgi:streptogramin lyase